MLAGVLLKLGSYGFLRICLPLFPDASLTIGLAGHRPAVRHRHHLWFAMCIWRRSDIKKLVAYSSVAHLGILHAGAVRPEHRRNHRQRPADDQSRPVDRSPLPHRRYDLRTLSHSHDGRSGRAGKSELPMIAMQHGVHLDVQHWTAWTERFRW